MSVTRADSTAVRTAPAVRVVIALALGVSSYLHIDLAQGPLFSDGKITLAGLFIGQAVVAALAAIWVLLRGDRPSLLVALLVGLASFAALVFSVYVNVPSFGPFPSVYEPLWYPEKVWAAIAAGVAAAAAGFGLARLPRH